MTAKAAKGRKIRVAVVGAGGQANNVHYPSLASMSDVEIVAICDIDPVKLNATADTYGVEKRYGPDGNPGAYRKMVEEVAPDAIYVIGPPNIVYDIWVWCLQQGLNLFIEKPMGITLHEARNLAYLAEKHHCITQVGFQRRTCPMVVKLHQECLKRGPIVHACCSFYKRNIAPYLDARDHMMDDGVHAIDTLRWLCGGEVANVQSLIKRVQVPDVNWIGAMIEFDNGAVGVMLNSWSSGRRIFKVEMHAPGICVEAEHEGKGVLYADGDTKGVVYDTKEVAGSDKLWAYGGFLSKHREFIDCVKSKTQPGSNFSDAVKTMEVAEIILAQGLLEGR
jgi:predicted dehydrogenase